MDTYEEFFRLALHVVPTDNEGWRHVTKEHKDKFDNLAEKLGKDIPSLYNHLNDYRTALQNELLTPIFETKVSVRQPSGESDKVLTLENEREVKKEKK
jgi:hypothetical protein